MWKIREITDKVTNVVMNYSEVEAKVREATNDDEWGPHGSLMAEIAKYTFTYEHFPEVMGMLWKRMLTEPKKNWRRPYKSLLLLSYLVRNGSERVVTSAREHIYDLRQLEDYTFKDELGRDQGINVRQKTKDLIDFIQDDERLRTERKKAKKTKDKYIGMSSDAFEGGGSSRYKRSPDGDRYDPEPRNMSAMKEYDDEIERQNKTRPKFSLPARIFEDSPAGSIGESDEDEGYADEPTNRKGKKWQKDNGGSGGGGDEDAEEAYSDSEDRGSNSFKDEETYESHETTMTTRKERVTKRTSRGKIDLGAAASYGKTAGRTEETKEANPVAAKPTNDLDLLVDTAPPVMQPTSPAGSSSGFANFADFNSAPATDGFDPRGRTVSQALGSQSQTLLDLSAPASSQYTAFTSTSFPTLSSQGSDFGAFQAVPNSPPEQSYSAFQSTEFSTTTSTNMASANVSNQALLGAMIAPQPMQMMQPMGAAPLQPQPVLQPSQPQFPSITPQPSSSTPPASASEAGTPQPVARLWANTNVNINLDNLSPGRQPERPAQPSMNQLAGQSPMGGMPAGMTSPQQMMSPTSPMGGMPANMAAMPTSMGPITSGMGNMQLGTNPQMMNPMMQPMGMQGTMGMQPGMGMQGNMGMQPGMGMGMQGTMGMQPGMQQGMGMQGTMGMQQGMMGGGMGAVPNPMQQRQDKAFAAFGNFGK
ncbi:clathrin interactor 1-like isoform X2 [Branchiostoma floridae]|uniref:Clathrin interactor 1-like isoform X2 n=1 Tax=Branchiostoma floridae TaxID=7739 RepID=A0A9J7L1V3_BRAFL|nr:clathrin interactor 1-like isoform X2 [Branchiostoma floridae]